MAGFLLLTQMVDMADFIYPSFGGGNSLPELRWCVQGARAPHITQVNETHQCPYWCCCCLCIFDFSSSFRCISVCYYDLHRTTSRAWKRHEGREVQTARGRANADELQRPSITAWCEVWSLLPNSNTKTEMEMRRALIVANESTTIHWPSKQWWGFLLTE